MAAAKGEPFQIAVADLRARLRDGVLSPGQRIAATEVADALGLSATPVREALSRLAGEGLLEDHRGLGFFVRRLAAADVADLFRLHLALVQIAVEAPLPPRARPAAEEPVLRTVTPADPVREADRLYADVVAARGSRALINAHRIVHIQLAPARRVEPMLFSDLADEAARLRGLDAPAPRPTAVEALRRFHARRAAAAAQIAALLEAPATSPEV